ncbi:MAG: 30S ribosomal protein S13 [Candidatus Aenigmarchaeota archaeon]|nr:30S ribosomal protein S13 [Candidatus Aenigmarchaeota archaeon]
MPEKPEAKPEVKKEPKKKPEEKRKPETETIRAEKIVRLVETNLDGGKPVLDAIRGVKGISRMFSHAVVAASGVPGGKKLGELSPQELQSLVDVIHHPAKYDVPSWLYNRRADPATGENTHLTASALLFSKKTDIDDLKKIKTYRGIRHGLGLPVRGQRTRGSFRTGKTIGVTRKKEAPATAKKT